MQIASKEQKAGAGDLAYSSNLKKEAVPSSKISTRLHGVTFKKTELFI
jgi:hypothetical protein